MRLFVIVALLLIAPPAWGHPVLDVARKDLYVRELHQRNDHPRIDEVLRYMGLPLGQPYCASFVVWWYNHTGNGQVLPKYGRVAMLRDHLADRETKYRIIPAEDVALGITKLREADIIFWANGRIAKIKGRVDFNGHTGLVTEQTGRRSFDTIEANTQPGESGDQREGGGVYERHRKLTLEGSFRILDFGRLR